MIYKSPRTSVEGIKTHFRQSPTDSPRLLWAEVKRHEFLSLVVLPEVLASLLVHDR